MHRNLARRRPVALLAVLALLAGALAACTSSAGDVAQPTPGHASGRPNIVFVLTDDLSFNLLPFMPHVRAMEREGMSFSNYTVTDSQCCPSRSSIFTGMYPHDTHVLSNAYPTGGFRKFFQEGLEHHTFATALQSRGYRTAMMGKFLNQYDPSHTMGTAAPYVPPGWSEWDVAGEGGYGEYTYSLNQNSNVVRYGNLPQDYLTSVLDERAQDFIRTSAAQSAPFLLEVATFAPHRPYVPAPPDVHSFPGLKAPRSPAWDRLPTDPPAWLAQRHRLTHREIAFINTAFRKRVQAVQSVDRMIGNIERTLQRTGQAKNTYLVFSSDNGYHMGEYRLNPGKFTAFDTDIRVPLVVVGPGVPAGETNPAVVQNVDLAPTFDSIGGAAVPQRTDGRSMLPLLHGRTPANWPTLALIEHHGPDRNPHDPDYPGRGSGNPPTYAAIRGRSFLFVRYNNGGYEYYDLANDPYELHNLAGRLTPDQLRTLNHELTRLHTCHGLAECQQAGDVPGAGVVVSASRHLASALVHGDRGAHAAARSCTSGRAQIAGRRGRFRTGCTRIRRSAHRRTAQRRSASAARSHVPRRHRAHR